MNIFYKVSNETTVTITLLDENAPVVKCTEDFKNIWLDLCTSETIHRSDLSKNEISKEANDFLNLLDQLNFLPEINLATAQSIVYKKYFNKPPQGTYEVLEYDINVDVYAQDGGPSPGNTHDAYLGCWTPGNFHEDSCALP